MFALFMHMGFLCTQTHAKNTETLKFIDVHKDEPLLFTFVLLQFVSGIFRWWGEIIFEWVLKYCYSLGNRSV